MTGTVSYDPANHEQMVQSAGREGRGHASRPGPAYLWTGPEKGDVLVVGWGGTYGAIKAATLELRKQGVSVSACHLRYLNPLPAKLGELLKEFKHVLVPGAEPGPVADAAAGEVPDGRARA